MTREQSRKAAQRRLSRLVYRMDSAWVDHRLYRQKRQRAESPSLEQMREYEPPELDCVIDSPYFLVGHMPCLGYSGCNCWECECDCGQCHKCDPRASFPMSAEQTLLTHWKACVDTRDPVCIAAFADHLVELWAQAEAEDGEYARETGGTQPVLQLEHDGLRLTVDHTAPRFDQDGHIVNSGNVDVVMKPTRGPVAGILGKMRSKNMPPPSGWDYAEQTKFTSMISSFVCRTQHT